MIVLARPSVASLKLELIAFGAHVATATGFVVARSGISYLVTNWHNFTGRSADTRAWLSSGNHQTPDQVRIWHNCVGAPGQWMTVTETLLVDGVDPRWLQHPALGSEVDVAVLPLDRLPGVQTYPYELCPTGPQLAIGVSDSVFIVGFPFAEAGDGVTAIWARGSVATEPDLDFGGRRCFLVDSRTRPGQSGSPVIAYASGRDAVSMTNGSILVATGQPHERLLGVYSGRLNRESDLGFVWKADLIVEIIDGGVAGDL